jgi:hypothetical protein
MSQFVILFLLMVCIMSISVNSAKILVVAPMPSYSHFTVAFRLGKELSDRGHQVTTISPYPLQVPIENYRDVSVEENIEIMDGKLLFQCRNAYKCIVGCRRKENFLWKESTRHYRKYFVSVQDVLSDNSVHTSQPKRTKTYEFWGRI